MLPSRKHSVHSLLSSIRIAPVQNHSYLPTKYKLTVSLFENVSKRTDHCFLQTFAMLASQITHQSLGSSTALASNIWQTGRLPTASCRSEATTQTVTPCDSNAASPPEVPRLLLMERARADYYALATTHARLPQAARTPNEPWKASDRRDTRLCRKYETYLHIATRIRDDHEAHLRHLRSVDSGSSCTCSEILGTGFSCVDCQEAWVCERDLAGCVLWMERQIDELQNLVSHFRQPAS